MNLYEQKYKEALERAKKELRTCGSLECDAARQIFRFFPELKESEDDRIRKEIIRIVDGYFPDKTSTQRKEYIAWLEKQREKNTADKVEPKFKVGDWVVLNENHNSIYKVTKIENYHYVLRHILGGDFTMPFGLESSMRPWTIQDAKDGDVLIDAFDSPFIYAGCTDKYAKRYIAFYTHHEYSGLTDFSSPQNWEDKNYVHPATKEQRNLLFAKMKEAGYEWNAETKQITKEESTDKEKQLDADIDLYYQTYGNGHNAFDGLSLEKFRDIVKQFINDYR